MAILSTLPDINLNILLATRKHLVSAVALALAGVILLILAYTQVPGILATSQRLKVEEKKVADLNQKVLLLDQLKVSPEFNQTDEMDRILPSHKPLLELLNNLNAVGSQTNVSITEFEVSPGEIATDSTKPSDEQAERPKTQSNSGDDYDSLALELTVRGTLEQVQQFMELIERVSPITTITELSLERETSSETGQPTGITRAQLALSAYYYTKSITAAISTALPEISESERVVFQTILDFTPSNLEEQTSIISGSSQDLFGISGLNVTALEQAIDESIETPQ